MQTISFDRVGFPGGFWRERSELNRRATIPQVLELCRRTGRIEAMKLAWRPDEPDRPHHFWDSDVAKWMEAAAYELKKEDDPELRARLDEIIGLIAAAQDNDGYFNSFFQTVEPRHRRFSNLKDMHELYTAGHLFEAAAAHFEATGETSLLEPMRRCADHIVRRFGPAPEQWHGYPGHEEIELALVRLYQATGEERYRELAAYFVRERGKTPNYFVEEGKRLDKELKAEDMTYYQAHRPIGEQEEAVGHAVRALYFYSGAADVARLERDERLAADCRRLWNDIVRRKMYITGATGSCYHGETFTDSYDLPNAAAYAETCAAIALVFFSWRMFLLDGDACYLDVLERALYNGVLSGISLDGRKFFYVNPLTCRPDTTLSNGRRHVPRTDWFNCSCCPPNLARIFASVGQYFYSHGDAAIYVNMYGDSETAIELGTGPVRVTQRSAYPWDGKIALGIDPAAPARFAVRLRLPGWCAAPSARVNGRAVPMTAERGFLGLDREWQPGDRIELELPMTPQLVYADPRVQENTGRAAIQRGPLVYCLEEADNGRGLDRIAIPAEPEFTETTIDGLPEAMVGLRLRAVRTAAPGPGDDGALYSSRPPAAEPCEVTAVPYYAWNNRGFGEMQVWHRVKQGGLES